MDALRDQLGGAHSDVASVVEIHGNTVRVAPQQGTHEPLREPSSYERFLKPLIDFVGALVLLVITSPFLLVAAAAIRITMGREVLLRQERVGKDGVVFTVFKLRSMEPNRRQTSVPFVGEDRRKTHKHPDDPRLTAVGRFIRKWSIDEIPQFINVLRGEMSLVGPRPEMVDIVAGYAPWQHQRHLVKPGLTGLWQISERGNRPLHEATELDLEYIESLSVARDLKILLLTPIAAAGGRTGS